MASCEFASRERAMNPEQVAPLDVHLLCRLDTRPPGPCSCSIFLQRVPIPSPLSLSTFICIHIYVYLFSSFYYHFSGQLRKLATLGPVEDLCPSFPFSSSSSSSSRFLLPRPSTLPFAKQLASFNLLPANLRYIHATWPVLDNLLC